ncbi:hypothetical protein [Thermodesulfovibrio hydrogeniphilus]
MYTNQKRRSLCSSKSLGQQKRKYKTYEIAETCRDKETKKVSQKIIANITHPCEPLIFQIRHLLKSPEKKVVVDKDVFFKETQ